MNEMQAHGLLIPVGSMPIEVWIDKNNSLDELQNFVNGNVEVLRVLGNGVDLWVNDEGLFNGSQPNRATAVISSPSVSTRKAKSQAFLRRRSTS